MTPPVFSLCIPTRLGSSELTITYVEDDEKREQREQRKVLAPKVGRDSDAAFDVVLP